METDKWKMETYKHKMEIEKHKMETDKHRMETDKHKMETDKHKMETDKYKMETDKHKMETNKHKKETNKHKIGHMVPPMYLTAGRRISLQLWVSQLSPVCICIRESLRISCPLEYTIWHKLKIKCPAKKSPNFHNTV